MDLLKPQAGAYGVGVEYAYEEFDSATSLVAALEGGRGVALVSQALKSFAGPRLKILPLREH